MYCLEDVAGEDCEDGVVDDFVGQYSSRKGFLIELSLWFIFVFEVVAIS